MAQVSRIVVTADGTAWVGNDGRGLMRFASDGTPLPGFGGSDGHITALAAAGDIVWAGTRGGWAYRLTGSPAGVDAAAFQVVPAVGPSPAALDERVEIPAGWFLMGSDSHRSGRGPAAVGLPSRLLHRPLRSHEPPLRRLRHGHRPSRGRLLAGPGPHARPQRVPGGRPALGGSGGLLRLGGRPPPHRGRVGEGRPGHRWAHLALGERMGPGQSEHGRIGGRRPGARRLLRRGGVALPPRRHGAATSRSG